MGYTKKLILEDFQEIFLNIYYFIDVIKIKLNKTDILRKNFEKNKKMKKIK